MNATRFEQNATELLTRGKEWLQAEVLAWSSLEQILIILLCLGFGLLVGRQLQQNLKSKYGQRLEGESLSLRIGRRTLRNAPWLAALTLLLLAMFFHSQLDLPINLIRTGVSLLAAWAVISLGAVLVKSRTQARILAGLAWSLAALNILGLLGPAMAALGDIGFHVGHVRLSLLSVIKGVIVLFIFIKIGFYLSSLLESRLSKEENLTPSVRVLMNKTARVMVVALAAITAMTSIGLNLSALAVFGGALGVGVGFGLKEVISNLISGVILLMDKSIKPNDVIQIGDTFGWITQIHSRYVSLETRDGAEYLIPNEHLISSQVINWSYTDRKIRLKVPVGVSYDSDINLCLDLLIQAARDVPRVLDDPPPASRLIRFGDSSIDLELRFWITDPEKGVTNIKSAIQLNIWNLFKKHGVEIPFPQRDVNLKTAAGSTDPDRD